MGKFCHCECQFWLGVKICHLVGVYMCHLVDVTHFSFGGSYDKGVNMRSLRMSVLLGVEVCHLVRRRNMSFDGYLHMSTG